MQLSHAIELFLLTKVAEERKNTTIEWYEWQLHMFQKWAEGQPAKELSSVLIEEYLAHRRNLGLQPKTIAGAYRALTVWCNWLKARGYITQAPTKPLKAPRIPDRRPRYTTKEDAIALIRSIPPDHWLNCRDRAIIATLFYTGIRVSELVRLKIEDIDEGKSVLWVSDRKANEDSFAPILPRLKDYLTTYLSVRPKWKDMHLFLSSDGWKEADGHLSITGVRQMLRRRCNAIKIGRITPHMFRHGLAMHLTEMGADSKLIQLVLGHRDRRSTDRYARWNTSTVVNRYFEIWKA